MVSRLVGVLSANGHVLVADGIERNPGRLVLPAEGRPVEMLGLSSLYPTLERVAGDHRELRVEVHGIPIDAEGSGMSAGFGHRVEAHILTPSNGRRKSLRPL